MLAGVLFLLLSQKVEGHEADPSVGVIVDEVAAQFVAARARGRQGAEPPALKAAARAYKSKISSLPMPWKENEDISRREEKIPNIVHWAWRSGDADWTLALSVVMAAVVQRPQKVYIHTGPVASGAETYTSPRTQSGEDALRCMRAAGAEEILHRAEPSPFGDDTRHPWSEVMPRHGQKLTKQTFAHISDVMRLYTILQYGGLYLDRDAFQHLPLHDYRYKYDAVLGIDPETFEGDHDVNFGSFMGAPNATYFHLLWDGMDLPEYTNLSYRVTWGGWAHDSCRKSFALAIKRPDLVHVTERLYQFPFPGKSAGRGPRGHIPPALLEKTKINNVLHMSGFEWHSQRTEQLRWKPSIWGEIIWPNVLKAAHDPSLPHISPELESCLDWLQTKLTDRGYIDPSPASSENSPSSS